MSVQQDVMIHTIITDIYEVCACNLDTVLKMFLVNKRKKTIIVFKWICLQICSRTNLRAKSPKETESLAPGQIVVAAAWAQDFPEHRGRGYGDILRQRGGHQLDSALDEREPGERQFHKPCVVCQPHRVGRGVPQQLAQLAASSGMRRVGGHDLFQLEQAHRWALFHGSL